MLDLGVHGFETSETRSELAWLGKREVEVFREAIVAEQQRFGAVPPLNDSTMPNMS